MIEEMKSNPAEIKTWLCGKNAEMQCTLTNSN